MLPFLQLAGIGLYYVTGCTLFRSIVWWSAVYGLVVKFLRCYLYHCEKGNDWGAFCKVKREKLCSKLSNLDRQKGMGLVFLVILVLGSAFVLFLKFPVAIFWGVAFLVPKCPEPTVETDSVELKETTKKAAKKPPVKKTKARQKNPAKPCVKNYCRHSACTSQQASCSLGRLPPRTWSKEPQVSSSVEPAHPKRYLRLSDSHHTLVCFS